MITAMSAFASVVSRMPEGVTPRQAAFVLAAARVPVFPVATSKRPITPHGFHDASTDPRQISTWWNRHPSANLAIPTGSVSGVDVVDVDMHGQVNGYLALNRAHAAGLIDGWEMAVRSPSGGLHLYFPVAQDSAVQRAAQRSWQAARAGIDFRGDGGYIIVPPSSCTIDGTHAAYKVLRVNIGLPGPLNATRLRDFLDPRPPKPLQAANPGESFNVERVAAWVSRLQEGERNHGLYWAACKMAENHVSWATALDELGAAAIHAGLTEREVAVTVRSAYRATSTTPARRSHSPFKTPDRPPPTDLRSRVLS